jgi:hypothetical protein
MAELTDQEIMKIANQYIDEQFPTPLGNKKNVELRDKQAIERTTIFVAGLSRGLTKAIEIFKS